MTKASITTKIKSNEKNEAKVDVIVSIDLINEEKQETIQHMASHVSIKGFRKGKAPIDLVEKQLDQNKVMDHLLDHLFPKVLAQVFKDHKLEPLGYPKAKIVKTPANEDWEFELTIALKPTIELGDYKKVVSKTNPTKIWTPKEGEQEKTKDQQDNEKLQSIFTALIENVKIDVPQSLIEDEVNNSLSRLLQQTQSLGLTLEDYLKSANKTPESIREDYAKSAEESIKLELILDAIGSDLKLEATEKEINEMIAASGDEETKKRLDTPSQRRHIGAILKQRHTLEELLKM